MARTFVAIALPEAAREALAGHLARCAAAAPGFRWVEAAGLHLTLRFVGSVPEPALEALLVRLREIRCEPFELRLGAGGSFGGAGRARVVWLGVERGGEPLTKLAARCEAACAAAGLEPEGRPYRPHVTLARARGAAGAALPPLPAAPALAAWVVEEFALFESRPRAGRPPEYVARERFRLAG